ncbi:hypothetical protein [Spiroplasma endosymbiont of Megaselia nigra]|uniref:hypothetical protein n=1 Tax=Spiroplasma endosymbiont of Megaselia nigra TaxID=2478537 RepID=UPI0018AD5B55|nr:hypothetical protein [Spiroplasma endosymbiont of Megaselia nigra]
MLFWLSCAWIALGPGCDYKFNNSWLDNFKRGGFAIGFIFDLGKYHWVFFCASIIALSVFNTKLLSLVLKFW